MKQRGLDLRKIEQRANLGELHQHRLGRQILRAKGPENEVRQSERKLFGINRADTRLFIRICSFGFA
jgi:hypothetical protein